MKKQTIVELLVVAVVAVIGGGAVWWTTKPKDTEDAPRPKSTKTVVLTPEKFAGVTIRSIPATRSAVEQVCSVMGKIAYRRVRRVELKAPVDSVVQEVKVKPGDAIEPGSPLALMTSPGVGQVRAEVEKSESDLKIANRAQEWNDAVSRNLGELLVYLRKKPQSQEVEANFNDKLLGDHRGRVLSAYSKYMLAQKLWDAAEQLARKGSISEQKSRQLEADRDVAWENFLTACEQSEYDAWKAREKASQERTYARRLVDVNRQKLTTLLGEFSKPDSLEDQSAVDASELTRFLMIAPFAGTVEQRIASDAQRVEAGTVLFVVANTDVLEVVAEIRDGDWQAVAPYLRDGEGKVLTVLVTALGEDRRFEATIDYVGRFVDDQNKAVPLMALVENPRHELVPGMFARINIPTGRATDELVVPPAALLTVDRQDFVFVEDEREPRTYHRVDVQVGRQTSAGATIARGLKAGQKVVVEGAVVLMNELLLPLEAEE